MFAYNCVRFVTWLIRSMLASFVSFSWSAFPREAGSAFAAWPCLVAVRFGGGWVVGWSVGVCFEVLSWGPLTAGRPHYCSTTASKQRPNNVHQRPNNYQTTTKQRRQRPNNDQTMTKQRHSVHQRPNSDQTTPKWRPSTSK